MKPTRKKYSFKMGCFWIEWCKTKTKVITKANQEIGEIPFRANKIQSKNKQTASSAVQRMRRSRDWLQSYIDRTSKYQLIFSWGRTGSRNFHTLCISSYSPQQISLSLNPICLLLFFSVVRSPRVHFLIWSRCPPVSTYHLRKLLLNPA